MDGCRYERPAGAEACFLGQQGMEKTQSHWFAGFRLGIEDWREGLPTQTVVFERRRRRRARTPVFFCFVPRRFDSVIGGTCNVSRATPIGARRDSRDGRRGAAPRGRGGRRGRARGPPASPAVHPHRLGQGASRPARTRPPRRSLSRRAGVSISFFFVGGNLRRSRTRGRGVRSPARDARLARRRLDRASPSASARAPPRARRPPETDLVGPPRAVRFRFWHLVAPPRASPPPSPSI